MNRKALIVYGGWEGHEPEKVAHIFKDMLKGEEFEVELSDSLEVYKNKGKLKSFDLIVPHWTMGEMGAKEVDAVLDAVAGGVGIAGCHAGLCDAFRASPDWQFMAGGQLVAHVGAAGIDGNGIEFEVQVVDESDPIMSGIKDFRVYDEQYYVQVDPAIRVLATTRVPPREGKLESEGRAAMNFDFGFGNWNFDSHAVLAGPHVGNGKATVPVVWTKYWGRGRVFNNSLGHDAKRVASEPSLTITKRGFLWAARPR
jgi:type 1 glutamine amidotransferase